MDAVLPGVPGRDIPFPTMYGTLFAVELPQVMGALRRDPSPRAQLRAVALYHQVVEGVLAEIGYAMFYDAFDANGLMPGLVRGIRHIQRDEVRHIAFGTHLCRRILNERPELEAEFDAAMEEFRPHGEFFPQQIFKDYPPDRIPFDLKREKYIRLADQYFQSRRQHAKVAKV
jgi:ribonucleoside-diphosphate reductase beta chain